MVGGITGGFGGDPSGIDVIGAAASGNKPGSLGGGGSFRGGLRPLFACGPDADSKCGEAFG